MEDEVGGAVCSLCRRSTRRDAPPEHLDNEPVEDREQPGALQVEELRRDRDTASFSDQSGERVADEPLTPGSFPVRIGCFDQVEVGGDLGQPAATARLLRLRSRASRDRFPRLRCYLSPGLKT